MARFGQRHSRHGVSLMEILISIGIISVGLLGVVALLPVAAMQVRRGIDADSAAMIGQNAARSVRTRGMTNPANWRSANPTFSITGPLSVITQKQSICIDPRFVADHPPFKPIAVPPILPSPDPYNYTLFPYYDTTPANPRMWRVSVAATPYLGAAIDNLPTPAMTRFQADRIFVDQDRLVVGRPDDDTLLAVQQFDYHRGIDGVWGGAGDDDGNGFTDDGAEAGWGGSDDRHALRQKRGDISWLATLVPQLHPNELAYTLSIVVFAGRSSDLQMNGQQERLVNVTEFYSAGLGGGDVRLCTRPGRPKEDLEVRVGDWIMLSGKLVPGNWDRFAWYRVLSIATDIDELDTDSDGIPDLYCREVALAGRDWNRMEWVGLPPTDVNFRPTQATIMTGVISVFQRTVKLESFTLWN